MSAPGGESVVEERRQGGVKEDTSSEADGISQCLKGVGTFTIGSENNEEKDGPCKNSFKTR